MVVGGAAQVARRSENPVSVVLHEMGGLLTDFCERLLEQLNDVATCNPQVQNFLTRFSRLFSLLGWLELVF